MIDWTRVTELRDEIGAEDFQEVIDLFLEEVEGTLDTLTSLTNAAALEAAYHFLKGGALNLGFQAMAELCQSGEASAGLGQMDGVDPDEVMRVYAISKAQFLDGMQERFAA
ncbi:Hpt domain-containing protein [Thalassococcus sp. BH17M4-6]|uniref:Hpt domain-containing protein n=1 Tax=Thalassococcus sp. BH17M4-6 TaxID=3413148 RepID=UPI003BE01C09